LLNKNAAFVHHHCIKTGQFVHFGCTKRRFHQELGGTAAHLSPASAMAGGMIISREKTAASRTDFIY